MTTRVSTSSTLRNALTSRLVENWREVRHHIGAFIGLAAPSAPQKVTCTVTSQATSRDKAIQLAPGQLWSGSLQSGQEIACQAGLVWLTQSDDQTDYIMRPAQNFAAYNRGHIVVQALEESVFTIQV